MLLLPNVTVDAPISLVTTVNHCHCRHLLSSLVGMSMGRVPVNFKCAIAIDYSNDVTSSFSLITPNSAIFQVIIRGGGDGGFLGKRVAALAGGTTPTVETPAAEEKKKEEKVEESDDEDMGFSLFD
ncbi:Uncharacterized protein TCM_004261 [Theobroma cacao]|uniref:60S acidic ribosomal protein family n=1 Tax=Theobroma cacao TaxID=3641 RepID=A0A061DRB7_THECC|nr:Uncharacterized protein TCM_004261 [Theobroma cacao]